jgi:exopolyphosphatase/guanosine-5'-triphosphate,3'-diphosphate pyrophosphatase
MAFKLELPTDWLSSNPWTAAAIGEEAAIWRQIGREYVVNSKPLRKIA